VYFSAAAALHLLPETIALRTSTDAADQHGEVDDRRDQEQREHAAHAKHGEIARRQLADSILWDPPKTHAHATSSFAKPIAIERAA